MHLDATQLEFLAGLGKSPTGLQLKVLLSKAVEESNTNLRKMTGEDLSREQGRARCLDEILGWLDKPAAASRPIGKAPQAYRLDA